MATSKSTSTTKKPAAKKPAAPKPVVQASVNDAYDGENTMDQEVPVAVQKPMAAPAAPAAPAKKISFAQAMKQSPKVEMVIPIDPAYDDENQFMEFGYLGEAFILKRGVPITVNMLVKAEIDRRLKYQKEARERAKKERDKYAKLTGEQTF